MVDKRDVFDYAAEVGRRATKYFAPKISKIFGFGDYMTMADVKTNSLF